MECEICKEREGKITFIHILSNPIQTFLVCEECDINLLTQFYGLENNEAEKFLKEFLKEVEK